MNMVDQGLIFYIHDFYDNKHINNFHYFVKIKPNVDYTPE